MKNLKNIVCPKKKFPNDYNKIERKAIKAISDPKYKIVFFGSSVFKSLIYAGDIDLFQIVPLDKIINSMQYVIKNLLKTDFIMGDIKAGIKPEYSIFLDLLGKIDNGKIIGYKPELIRKIANENNIDDLKEAPLYYGLTINKWIDTYTKIHNLITLRWKPKDILNGYIIEDNKKYFLKDTIKARPDDALNKIDIYYMDNGRLIELTNVFLPSAPAVDNMIYGIKINLLTYLLPDKLNYLKALKRAYTASRMMPTLFYINDLNKITPILLSSINKFNTISTDLGVILDLAKADNKLTLKQFEYIIIHLENLINRINNMGFNVPNIINIINDAIDNIENKDLFVSLLKDAKNEVLKITNFNTKKYIKEYNINLNNFIP